MQVLVTSHFHREKDQRFRRRVLELADCTTWSQKSYRRSYLQYRRARAAGLVWQLAAYSSMHSYTPHAHAGRTPSIQVAWRGPHAGALPCQEERRRGFPAVLSQTANQPSAIGNASTASAQQMPVGQRASAQSSSFPSPIGHAPPKTNM